MSELVLIVLKANLCFVVFWLVYKAFFSQETFFTWNRLYLFFALVASLSIPFFELPGDQSLLGFTPYVLPTFDAAVEGGAAVGSTPEWSLSFLIYATGLIICSVWLLVGLGQIIHKRIHFPSQRKNGLTLVELPSGKEPFSFFQWVFIPKKQTDEHVIWQHEEAHAKGWHSLDGIIWNLTCIAFWYNPFVWMLWRELKSIHEFIADQEAAHACEKPSKYSSLLLGHAFQVSPDVFISHAFYHQTLIKKRIVMMQKNPSKVGSRWKYLALPVAILTLSFAAACTKSEGQKNCRSSNS